MNKALGIETCLGGFGLEKLVYVVVAYSKTHLPEIDWPTATDTADSISIVAVVKVSVCVSVIAAVVAADRVKAVPLIA